MLDYENRIRAYWLTTEHIDKVGPEFMKNEQDINQKENQVMKQEDSKIDNQEDQNCDPDQPMGSSKACPS